MRGVRAAIIVNAILAIVLGILVLAWPQATVALIGLLIGLYFLVAGIFRLGRGIFVRGAGGGSRVLNILLGVLLVIAGIVAIRNPLNSLIALGLVIGICWIIEGVAALVETAPDSSRWFGTLFGAISIVAGIVVLLSPLATIGVLVIVGGIFLIVSGVMQLLQAFTFGKAARGRAVPEPATAQRAARQQPAPQRQRDDYLS